MRSSLSLQQLIDAHKKCADLHLRAFNRLVGIDDKLADTSQRWCEYHMSQIARLEVRLADAGTSAPLRLLQTK